MSTIDPSAAEAVRLRETIEHAAADRGASLGELTVMSNQTDPYRIDTPANRRDAEWLASAWETSGARRPLHLRGLHYALVSIPGLAPMPDGRPYANTDECWGWLQSVSNRARWLGHIAFEDVTDERNGKPEVFTEYADEGTGEVVVEPFHGALWLPTSVSTMLPKIEVQFPRARQAYRLVFIGEKQSLSEVLLPIAQLYRAELVLPTGELSSTLLYGIAKRASDDGRPCRIFYLSDFDPSGYHMPIEVSRKLQALVEGFFPDLDIQLRRCALTAEQVRHEGLPSTPLKESERRANRWRERFGVEQTEIDALATLRPTVLQRIVRKAIKPYWDTTLEARRDKAVAAAVADAKALFTEVVTEHRLRIEEAETVLDEARAAAERADEQIAPVISDIVAETEAAVALIALDAPQPDPDGDIDEPMFCARRAWVDQTLTLRDEKL